MKSLFTLLLFVITIFISLNSSAQSNQEIAHKMGLEAIKLMDDGNFKESIKLLKEAEKLDPENYTYPYEIAFAHYQQKDYKKAIQLLEKLSTHKDFSDQGYQLIGNAHDLMGKPKNALETYEKGLKHFPNSGRLHLESGVVLINLQEYDKALDHFELGIEVDPTHSSNYYWASKLFCNSGEKVWGMIYGELFMNLERNSKRTAEISELLLKTYKKAISITSDTSYSISFNKNSSIDANSLKDGSKIKLPFGIGVYEPTMMMSTLFQKEIDINTLDTIRKNFLKIYFEKKYNKTYPNVLFDYQKQIESLGNLEAYNHWILMKGDEDKFGTWKNNNKEKWDSFVTWFENNKIIIDGTNKFSRGQY